MKDGGVYKNARKRAKWLAGFYKGVDLAGLIGNGKIKKSKRRIAT
jgi:hypothetical protein